MTQTVDTHAPQPKLGDPPPKPTPPEHTVDLSTSVSGNTITISGPGNFSLPLNQPATHCKFTLTDTSGANVQFDTLDAADNTTVCPAAGSGNNSAQVTGITTNNNSPQKTGQFTDNNNNQAPMDVSYAWNFTCDAPYTVSRFDPVISNGGKSSTF